MKTLHTSNKPIGNNVLLMIAEDFENHNSNPKVESREILNPKSASAKAIGSNALLMIAEDLKKIIPMREIIAREILNPCAYVEHNSAEPVSSNRMLIGWMLNANSN